MEGPKIKSKGSFRESFAKMAGGLNVPMHPVADQRCKRDASGKREEATTMARQTLTVMKRFAGEDCASHESIGWSMALIKKTFRYLLRGLWVFLLEALTWSRGRDGNAAATYRRLPCDEVGA